MPIGIGEYSIRSAKSTVAFWPLVPGTTTLTSGLIAPVAPNDGSTHNTLTLPVEHGVIDVVIEMSEPVQETTLTEEKSTDLLGKTVEGKPTIKSMPMIADEKSQPAARVARICFGVAIGKDAEAFEGTLELRAANATTATKTRRLRLPIKVRKWETARDLFVLFVANVGDGSPPKRDYCWLKAPVVEVTGVDPAPPLPSVPVRVRVLRDNQRGKYRARHRGATLRSDAAGLAAYEHGMIERTVLGLPVEWPLIFRVTPGKAHVLRAHMIRVKAADVRHNLEPIEIGPIRVLRVADTRMTMMRVLLDPGHGVVYDKENARRSQEWFVAHQVCEQIGAILTKRYGLPPANLLRTRSAGFGLIEPRRVRQGDAPEVGETKYALDLAANTIAIKQSALALHDLSDLLLAGDDDDPSKISEADRRHLLDANATAIKAIVARIDGKLPAGQQVDAASIAWDATAKRYVYTAVRASGASAGTAVGDPRPLPITTADRFDVSATMSSAVLVTKSLRTICSYRYSAGRSGSVASMNSSSKYACFVRTVFCALSRSAVLCLMPPPVVPCSKGSMYLRKSLATRSSSAVGAIPTSRAVPVPASAFSCTEIAMSQSSRFMKSRRTEACQLLVCRFPCRFLPVVCVAGSPAVYPGTIVSSVVTAFRA